MYFDERPKNTKKDLYGRKDELTRLLQSIKDKRALIIITGPRRVGKTSLLQTALSMKKIKSIRVDIRETIIDRELQSKDVMAMLRDSIQDFLDENEKTVSILMTILRTLKGISILGNSISIDYNPNNVNLKGLFKAIDKWAKQHHTTVVIAIDEIQDLATVDIKFDSLVAAIYDNYRNITFVLTGSEMGLLYEFLGIKNPLARLHGRSFVNIRLGPLKEIESRSFLYDGFSQKNMNPEKTVETVTILNEALKKFGGILGWLTDFGLKCTSNGEISRKYIKDIQVTGSVKARHEFDTFLKTREKPAAYKSVMVALYKYQYTSQDNFIKLYVEYDKTKKIVQELIENEFISKKEERYFFTDPLLQYSFDEELQGKPIHIKPKKKRIKKKTMQWKKK